jgi:hypothetical protein
MLQNVPSRLEEEEEEEENTLERRIRKNKQIGTKTIPQKQK